MKIINYIVFIQKYKVSLLRSYGIVIWVNLTHINFFLFDNESINHFKIYKEKI
jgi:hypothetical protein